jgi:hypothetical protein
MPELGPFGETFFEAKVLAMVLALFVNNPGGGYVESVFTFATHRVFLAVIRPQDPCLDGNQHSSLETTYTRGTCALTALLATAAFLRRTFAHPAFVAIIRSRF